MALAEEYHKPIMTVRLEAVSEMDPGLKLIIQRRQVCECVYVCVHIVYTSMANDLLIYPYISSCLCVTVDRFYGGVTN